MADAEQKVSSCSHEKRLSRYFIGKLKPPRANEALNLDVATNFLKIEIREKNILAYRDLILTQEDDKAFWLVDEACTKALPEEDSGSS